MEHIVLDEVNGAMNSIENKDDKFSEDLDISVVEDDSDSDSDESNDDDSVLEPEPEPLSELNLFFIYMNRENAIVRVETDVEPVPDNGIISKERILKIVQTKRIYDSKKYKSVDILSFHICDASTSSSAFDIRIEDSKVLTPVSLFSDVVILPTLYVFHDLTALYFFFSEMPSMKSRGVTKKVRFHDEANTNDVPSYNIRKRKSLKRFMRRTEARRPSDSENVPT